jgi:hypothetical protein
MKQFFSNTYPNHLIENKHSLEIDRMQIANGTVVRPINLTLKPFAFLFSFRYLKLRCGDKIKRHNAQAQPKLNLFS